MSIRVQCVCGQAFAAEQRLAGQMVPCPVCGGKLVIPPTMSDLASANLRPRDIPLQAGNPLATARFAIAIGAVALLIVVGVVVAIAISSAVAPSRHAAQQVAAPQSAEPPNASDRVTPQPVVKFPTTDLEISSRPTPRPVGELPEMPALPIPEGGTWIATDDGRYEFWSFADSPRSETYNTGPSYGITTTITHIFARPNTSYRILDSRVRRVIAQGLLDEAAIDAKRSLGREWKLISERRVKLSDLEAIELVFRHSYKKFSDSNRKYKGELRHMRVVITCSGTRLYQFMIFGPESEIQTEEANTIVGSFRQKRDTDL